MLASRRLRSLAICGRKRAAPAPPCRAYSKTHRYRITDKGLRTAIFYTGVYNQSLRTGLAIVSPAAINPELPIAKSIRAAECAVNSWYDNQKLAA